MDFLNKGMAQIADLFRSMTPGARITAGLLLAVVVISLAYLSNQQLSGGDAYLLGGQSFSAGEMSAMEAAFGKAGLSAYEVEGSRLRIPRGQQAAYMAALVDHGALPAHFGDFLTNAMDKVGPFTSRDQQRELIKLAKQRELANIILSMPGIEKATVQYDTDKKSGLRQDAVATASVGVKRHGTHPLEEKQVPMIRHLVAGAFAGLSPESVTVIDLNGRTYSGKSDGIGSASEDPYVARVREYQALFEARISAALSYVPGVTVTANVELNPELHHREEKDVYDPKNVATLRSTEETTTTSSKSAAPGGRPGLEAQGANQAARLTAGSASGNESSEDRTTSEIQNAPSRDHTLTELAGLTPKRVSVSIGVPSSYFENIWRQRNPAAAGDPAKTPDKAALDQIQKEETDKIRSHVNMLIPQPSQPADATASLVMVTTFEHVLSHDVDGPQLADQALAWLGNYWSTLGTLGLVLISLLMLRSLLRAPVGEPTSGELPMPTPAAAYEEVEEEPGEQPQKAKPRFKRRLGSGPSMREELVEIVREDPDAAANILRGWIGNAS
jgi:flagellar M-ring protein FliF